MPILVIGYGNPLRCDDGIGQLIAQELGKRHFPQVQSIAVHQLTPELTAILTKFNQVIFVDAHLLDNQQNVHSVVIEPVCLEQSQIASLGCLVGHLSDPRVLLNLTKALYHQVPQAWWVKVPGENFEIGDQLSATGKRNVKVALQQVTHLIQTVETKLCMKLE